MHRTILNMARCMSFAGPTFVFWGEALQFQSACRLLIVLKGEIPSISDLVVFGSPCTVYRNPQKRTWKPRAEVSPIIKKPDETKVYKVYIPRDRVVITTQHVQNVETLGGDRSRHLQKQLRREGPTPKQLVTSREEACKR